MSTISYSELDYSRPSGLYEYPRWAVGVGWGMAAIAASTIPGTAVYNIVKFCIIDGRVRSPATSIIDNSYRWVLLVSHAELPLGLYARTGSSVMLL